MSTRIGTLQAPGAGGPILLATFLVSLVMLTVAVVGVSFDRDQGGQAATTTFVGRHVINTPSELSAGIVGGAQQTFVGGTAANTPSEVNAQIRGGRTGIVPGGTLANTPTELSGGVIGDGLPAKFYDRHQRG
jgi:hypothetical protein